MAVKFTPEQQQAITATGGQLIVSAAAGSGKTAVLVERVMQLLETGKADISKLLVVTFTEAAAAEMKNKITRQLLDRLRENPKSALLRRQLSLMPSARVQTVHAFCSSLIRTEFVKCGVSHDFVLLDETEAEVLFEQALDTVFEEQYQAFGQNPDFCAFFENFSDERGDRELRSIVTELYRKLRSHPNPDDWCKYTADTAEMQPGQQPEDFNWGSYVLHLSRRLHAHAKQVLEAAYAELQTVEPVFVKYGTAFESAVNHSRVIQAAFEQGWDSAWEALHTFEKTSLSPCRYEDKVFLERMKNRRKQYVETVEKIAKQYMPLKTQYIVEESQKTAPIVRGICQMVVAFSAEFTRLKREANVLDFSDLEHLALNLLQGEDGTPSPLAQKLSGELFELLVDEFQDTNEIQDRIFRAITPHTGNVFFVGDVKQSIYKFRLANPVIFVDKYKSAQPFGTATDEKNRRIDLNKNFRSRKEVLGCTNFVFSKMMSAEFGDIDYDEAQALHTGATYGGEVPSEFYVIDMKEQGPEDEARQIEAEAAFVAGKIGAMLSDFSVENPGDGSRRNCQPEDFAILLSSYSSKCGYFEKELARRGIPVATAKKEGFGKTAEIAAVRGFLSAVDNPFQDVPMVSVMGSPFYGFTADDLITVRLAKPEGALYEGLCLLASQGDAKCAALQQDILRYAEYSRSHSIAQLIEAFYREKQVVEIFCQLPGGQDRRDNLENLLNIAESYEASGTKGLFRFLSYLERRFDTGRDEPTGGNGKGVQIMSIHKSKGLEFPVVFLPDLAKRFNTDDLKKSVLFHEELQIGIKYRSFATQQVYKSQMHSAVSAKLKAELAAEELRKLYVAMTRAKEKLIMVASFKHAERAINSWAESFEMGYGPGAAAEGGNFAHWLGGAFLAHRDAAALQGYLADGFSQLLEDGTAMVFGVVPPMESGETAVEIMLAPLPEPEQETPPQQLPYPWEQLTKIPAKLSPTGIKLVQQQAVPTVKDCFGKGEKDGALRGTALHRCMEHLEFAICCDLQTTADHLAQLYQEGRLPKEEQAMVDPGAVYGFVQCFREVLQGAQRVLREQQFAALFTPQELFGYGGTEDSIVVNGVIDMLIFTKEGLILVDYKSDYIFGTPEETAEKHRKQLEIYARAAQKLYGLPVVKGYVYLFRVNQPIALL